MKAWFLLWYQVMEIVSCHSESVRMVSVSIWFELPFLSALIAWDFEARAGTMWHMWTSKETSELKLFLIFHNAKFTLKGRDISC